MAKENYYKTLGLEDYCDDEERIKEAYERLNSSREELADDRIEKLDNAYEVLSDVGKKFLYDNDLKDENGHEDRSTLVDISSGEDSSKSYLSDYSDEIGSIGYPKKNSKAGIVAVAIIAVIVIVLIVVISSMLAGSRNTVVEPTTPVEPTTTETTTTTETQSELQEMYVSSGDIFRYPEDEAPAKIVIQTSGTKSYYIYLKDLSNKGRNDVVFFVRGGDSVSIDMPLGSYKFYYASGDKWYGSKYKFGEDTIYASSDELIEFTATEENGETYYDVWTIDLHPAEDGNMSSDTIREDQFPG